MNNFEEKLCCPALALIVLAVFYSIYFGKMLVQKRHGIRTRQIGRRKEKEIHTVETLMSIATLGAPMTQLMSIAFGWNYLPAGARFTGFLVGMLGDVIFLLSVLCMTKADYIEITGKGLPPYEHCERFFRET